MELRRRRRCPFQIVFVLRSVQDLSVEETAQCLALPEATVRTRYFRAKRLLREALSEEVSRSATSSTSAASAAIESSPVCGAGSHSRGRNQHPDSIRVD